MSWIASAGSLRCGQGGRLALIGILPTLRRHELQATSSASWCRVGRRLS
jgi:hypothetical protein